jgi:sec-independent protein translocase protein TatC
MSLLEHIQELRTRLIRSLLAIAAGTVVGFLIYPWVLRILAAPYCSLHPSLNGTATSGACQLYQFGVFEGFTIRLHVAAIAGVIISAPIWLAQLWGFLVPGLHKKERRFAYAFVGASLVLFAVGAAVAYLMLTKALSVLLHIAGNQVSPLLGVAPYLNFVTLLLLIFGVSFEFPLLPASRLRKWRRIEIFLVFLFAAVVVPSQDPFTMTALAVPLCLLYELAILIATVHDRRVAAALAAEQAQALPPDVASPLPEPAPSTEAIATVEDL